MTHTKVESTTRHPIAIPVEKGKTYSWCACGLSQQLPFCDGNHRGTSLKPKKFTATASEILRFCGCQQTQTPVVCDGSHKKLI